MNIKNLNFQFPKLELPRIDLPKIKLPEIKMPVLKLGDLRVKLPIVQGGMGVGISLSRLAASVANEGGIGVIAANAIGMIEPDYFKNGVEANVRALRKEIRKARALTDGIIGVNIMVALNDFPLMLKTSIEEKIDVVFMGAGLPLHGIPIDEIEKNNVKVVPIVSSARAAKLIFSFWQKKYGRVPDGVVVEGPRAGGHLGFKLEQIDDPDFKLEKLIPEVVFEISAFQKMFKRKIPVIAAGGIFTGADIYKFFKLGASAVQMGSRFVATEECDADIAFKESFVNARKKDITIIKSPVGLPGRAIRNSFLEDVEAGKRKRFKCPWKCLEHCKAEKAQYCISVALDNARKGKMRHGYAFAGSNAYRIKKIVPVRELVEELRKDYILLIETRTQKMKIEFEKTKKRLQNLKKEYEDALETSINQLKDEYARVVQKGSSMFREEIEKYLKNIEELKEEYIKNFRLMIEIRSNIRSALI